ncbi:MAG TPA: hypothetical protein VMK12_20255 [Anaeromyxobacteraceae bacterium]|nr:hypothetical protein [Anaeromyxobacteraceae bacterium]
MARPNPDETNSTTPELAPMPINLPLVAAELVIAGQLSGMRAHHGLLCRASPCMISKGARLGPSGQSRAAAAVEAGLARTWGLADSALLHTLTHMSQRAALLSLMSSLVALILPRAAHARTTNEFEEPARCVSDYLEAVAVAAPPHPRAQGLPPSPTGLEPPWIRVRSFLAPRAEKKLDAPAAAPQPLAPWSSLGREGAFLGYELLAVRRAPRGSVVVVAHERTARTPEAQPTVAACAYLLGKVEGKWRIADRRCGRDFSNTEVLTGYLGFWDEEDASLRTNVDEAFGNDLE